jgi:2-polyprenyl-3-methyl-5-hydroxy-6-metoxy-1,4-benzoquinol methylase
MPRSDLSKRSLAAEWLDGNGQSPDLPEYLRDLAWLNRVALGPWAIARWLGRATRHRQDGQPFTLLDVGCGDGDVLRAISRRAARTGPRFDLTGIDISAGTIAVAQARTRAGEIALRTGDVFAFTPARPFDFVISSLVAHHLDDAAIAELVRWMDAHARIGWLIYDLRRSAVSRHALRAVGTLARLHPMVVHDGCMSVQRSLTRAEWIDRIRAAGLAPADVRIESFVYRLLVSRLR